MAEYIKRETVTNHLDACMDTIWKPEIVALKCFVEGIPDNQGRSRKHLPKLRSLPRLSSG